MAEISVCNITPLKMIEERCIYSVFINQNKKNHTLVLFNIHTELQYGIIQYNVLKTSTCQGIIKNEIILLNLI